MSLTSPPVLRRSKRIHVQMPVDIVAEVQGAQVHHEATTLDFSTLGVRVQSSATLAPGERVQCVLEGTDRAIPSQVIWAAPPSAQQTREMGLQFLTPFRTIP